MLVIISVYFIEVYNYIYICLFSSICIVLLNKFIMWIRERERERERKREMGNITIILNYRSWFLFAYFLLKFEHVIMSLLRAIIKNSCLFLTKILQICGDIY
jgi:hypothetical protein